MAAGAPDPEQCEEFISKGEPCDPGLRPPQRWGKLVAAAVGAALLALLACSAALAARGHAPQGSAGPVLQLEESRQQGPEARHEYVIPARALESRACDRLLARLGDLDGQDLDTTADDPEFPPAIGSIGDPGKDCSDSAQGGAPSDCEEENHWSNFQDVAERMGKPFQVLDKPDFSDIDQGGLGDCYFMAAMASIAHARPKVIERMFVEREKWADFVYTTRWLLNGRVVRVRVDNMVPAPGRRRSAPYQRRRSNGHPFYARPSSDGEWWPVILEKAWAKMFGNYFATQSGKWANAVQAITMAPVIGYDHEDTAVDKMLELVKNATAKGFPMGGSVSPKGESKYGLTQHHSYAVLGARHDHAHGWVIKAFNPHNDDHYHGSMANEDKSDGVFGMTPAEYHEAYKRTYIAMVHEDYKVASKRVQTASTDLTSWEVSIAGSDVFYVTLSWPGDRIVEPCESVDPVPTLIVAKKGSVEFVAPTMKLFSTLTAVSVEVRAGPGDYVVLAGLDFPQKDKVHEGHLLVHSAQHTTIRRTEKDAATLMASLLAPVDGHGDPCTVVSMGTRGVFTFKKEELVSSMPTYWSQDKGEFAYWVGRSEKWYVTDVSDLEKVRAGVQTRYEKFAKGEMSCSSPPPEPSRRRRRRRRRRAQSRLLEECADGESAAASGNCSQGCVDFAPPSIGDDAGRRFGACAELRGRCGGSAAVRERCCATCGAGRAPGK